MSSSGWLFKHVEVDFIFIVAKVLINKLNELFKYKYQKQPIIFCKSRNRSNFHENKKMLNPLSRRVSEAGDTQQYIENDNTVNDMDTTNFKFSCLLTLMVEITHTSATIKLVFFIIGVDIGSHS